MNMYKESANWPQVPFQLSRLWLKFGDWGLVVETETNETASLDRIDIVGTDHAQGRTTLPEYLPIQCEA